MEYRRDPDALLRWYDKEEPRHAGKLKIFFGYAAGVGKTYAMLEAAHQAKKAGVDVVVGYIEPHGRPETERLVQGLEQIPPLSIAHKNITLREFDLDAALKRHPQLILVDELAHTNAEGSRHSKRYKDVEELIKAGIDVYTTVNVQHLESLNDVVSSITGIAMRERVPDLVFDSADQVEVVDIEPDDLIARLEEGKIYKEGQAHKALSAFFSKKNLAALREIALRRTADRLNRSAKNAPGEGAASDHILVLLTSLEENARVIRTAARLNEALDGRFTALIVEPTDASDESVDERKGLRQNTKLAEDLGAVIVTLFGDDTAAQIAEYAKLSGVTKIVLGRTQAPHRFFATNSSLVTKLSQLAPKLDIYLIPNQLTPQSRGVRRWLYHQRDALRPSLMDLLKGLLLVVIATLAGLALFHSGFGEENVIIFYFLAVLVAAVWTGNLACGAIISLLSVFAFNYFFTEPLHTFQAYMPSYPMTFVIMFVASTLTTSLVTRIKRQSQQAARKAYRMEVLLETSQMLQTAPGEEEIIRLTALQLVRLIGEPVVFYQSLQNGLLSTPQTFTLDNSEFPADALGEDERAVAYWTYKNNQHAGNSTNTLPNARCLYYAVRGRDTALAVAGIYLRNRKGDLDAFDKNLIKALLDECGLALEKQNIFEEKKEVEIKAQQEELRVNLLRAISHDLRTPLTSISGNAALLLEEMPNLTHDKRHELYSDIYDDAMWLVNLVENLLSITRIENGTMDLTVQPELVDEVFHEAMLHLDRHRIEHDIKVKLDDDMLMADMDARLIIQVIINLMNNAIKYTPEGSHICLQGRKIGHTVRIAVSDDGPGISEEDKKHLFEMFYTGGNRESGDSGRGLGLGLSLCKSIIEAHGGTIKVRNCSPRGVSFEFTLHATKQGKKDE